MNALNDLPAPLTPSDCDLRHLPSMLLDVARLCDSDMATIATADEFRASVLLWCKAWHQVPAASLPDDDRVLAQLSGYGRVVSEWLKVKDGAMRGWVRCSDGRWYHAVVAEKANEAWESSLKRDHGKFVDRLRKKDKTIQPPTFEQWIAAGKPSDFPLPSAGIPTEIQNPSAGIPTEIALKVKEGKGKEYKEPKTLVGQKPDDVAVEADDDEQGNGKPTEGQQGDRDMAEGGKTQAKTIEGVFGYWKRVTGHSKAQLGDKRIKVIRAALKWGYSPHDLCRAIQGCTLTPHNQGVNNRSQKYDDIELILRDEGHIDRFMANATTPPKAPTKATTGQIPGWWESDDLAQQQAALVGVSGPHPTDTRQTFHGRIRAAIENGGKPPAPVAAAAPAPATPPGERVQMTDEQKAANRSALLSALKGTGVKVMGNAISMD
ncbi:DUF1376 domain-containing protein [Paraburkholderia tropica]|uniref:DUF1376 domain-containing protein n=1 Tax=Paraburkholderia tropica TaxID=92647 RepID=UPI002AB05555|nr:DUF1376 domain-containing protein [Paraburkholderia tropica]